MINQSPEFNFSPFFVPEARRFPVGTFVAALPARTRWPRWDDIQWVLVGTLFSVHRGYWTLYYIRRKECSEMGFYYVYFASDGRTQASVPKAGILRITHGTNGPEVIEDAPCQEGSNILLMGPSNVVYMVKPGEWNNLYVKLWDEAEEEFDFTVKKVSLLKVYEYAHPMEMTAMKDF